MHTYTPGSRCITRIHLHFVHDRPRITVYSHTLQKEKGRFNPARVISVASSLPNNVHTSRSITLLTSIMYNRTGLQFQTESKQLSEVMQVYIATITGMLDVQLHYNPFIAGAIEMKNTAALQTFL